MLFAIILLKGITIYDILCSVFLKACRNADVFQDENGF